MTDDDAPNEHAEADALAASVGIETDDRDVDDEGRTDGGAPFVVLDAPASEAEVDALVRLAAGALEFVVQLIGPRIGASPAEVIDLATLGDDELALLRLTAPGAVPAFRRVLEDSSSPWPFLACFALVSFGRVAQLREIRTRDRSTEAKSARHHQGHAQAKPAQQAQPAQHEGEQAHDGKVFPGQWLST